MTRVRPQARSLATWLVAALPLLGACTSRPVSMGPSPEMAGMAPMLSVERFLQAANARDFDAMRRLFGTYAGPVQGERREVEIRMSLIAEVLHHQDYSIVGQRREPGREHPTTRVVVTLTKDGQVIPEVPFLVVSTGDGAWLVEQIDLERITNR